MNSKKKILNSKNSILNLILMIITLIFVIYTFIKIKQSLIKYIKYVFDTYTAISVALITGLLAFVSVPIGKYFENRYNIKNKIREERQKVYIEFLNWLIKNVLYAEVTNNKNIIEELREQQKYMTIYASDNVLKAWSDFKTSAMNSEQNKKGLTKEETTKYYLENEAPKIEDLILAIRKELGYKNKNINQYDILKLYINDINKYLN